MKVYFGRFNLTECINCELLSSNKLFSSEFSLLISDACEKVVNGNGKKNFVGTGVRSSS